MTTPHPSASARGLRLQSLALAGALLVAPGAWAQEQNAPTSNTVDPVTGEAVEASPPAQATPGPQAPPPPPPQKADPKLFEEALADYFARDPRDAAPKFYAYLEGAPQTDENYAWAQYFLAKSLLDLKLTHAAGDYLARIARERTNPQVLPKALDELRVLTDIPHDEITIDEQIFGSLDLAFLPSETGAFAHYQQGMIALKVGNERWAENHFSKLDPETPEASRAKFALLVTRLKRAKKIDEGMITSFLELSKDPKLTAEMRNEAMLAVARLRYEREEFEGALEAYSQVKLPPLDPGQATLYLEEAWTRYQLGQIHAAMGLLTTLEAPSFRDEFLPDKYLLRAFIYRDLCHYLPAKRAAKELNRRFADSLEAIRERQELTEDLRLRRAAMATGATKRSADYLRALELEGERMGRFAGSFGERLFSHLVKLYDLSRAEAQRVFQHELNEAVRHEADKLLRASEQVRLMDYEVGLKLYERVKRGSKLVTAAEEKALEIDQVAFRFKGEYWNDELRSFRFSLKSRCIEDTAK
ncbi:MAG: hypothetical protein WBV82_18720 [Myxococcaceae bacterium]